MYCYYYIIYIYKVIEKILVLLWSIIALRKIFDRYWHLSFTSSATQYLINAIAKTIELITFI